MKSEEIKVFVVIDTDSARLMESLATLQDYGKAYDAQRPADMNGIYEVESRVDAVFVSSKMPHLRENVANIMQIIKDGTQVFVVGDVNPDSLGDLFNLGVKDSICYPINPSDINLHRPLSATTLVGEGRKIDVNFGGNSITRERFVVVCKPKGGTGGSVFSLQIGAAMAKLSGQTVLIDADYCGNITRIADLESINSIAEFSDEQSMKYDREQLNEKLVTHQASGLKILSSPLNAMAAIPTATLQHAFSAYKRFYSQIVVDLHAGYTPHLDYLKDYATDVVVIIDSDRRHMERNSEFFTKLMNRNIDQQKIHIIVNRPRNREEIEHVRYALRRLGMEHINLHVLPETKEFKQDSLPMYNEPRKSPYSKAIRTIFREMKLNNGAGTKSDKETTKNDQAEKPKAKWLGLRGLLYRR
ncbi:CpaE family protein [Paenibacillus sp. GCM10027627]|uniref:AAA family ATPase n=1 Tax=unclassified Paenibacillus TaxID=185978 RepID=UPI003636625D